MASSTVVAMLAMHNFLNTWKHKIDGFICVSEFVKMQLMAGGLGSSKLYVKHNFVFTDIEPNFKNGEYYIYVGRLSEEKGLDILLRAFNNNSRKLIIVGEGSLQNMIELFAKKARIYVI